MPVTTYKVLIRYLFSDVRNLQTTFLWGEVKDSHFPRLKIWNTNSWKKRSSTNVLMDLRYTEIAAQVKFIRHSFMTFVWIQQHFHFWKGVILIWIFVRNLLLQIRQIEGKGRGVFSTRHFERKEFIVEYSGTLISYEEAKKREAEYVKEPEKYGCYMYYFVFKNKKYWWVKIFCIQHSFMQFTINVGVLK